MKDLIKKIEQWSVERDLDNKKPMKQYDKLIEEHGELMKGLNKQDEQMIKDSIGDMFVVMTIMTQQIKGSMAMVMDFEHNDELKALGEVSTLRFIGILFGLGKALKNNKLWSRKSLFGYARKLLIFCIIVLANIIDQILGTNGGILFVTIFFYIANEGLSIIENCAEMGVLVPPEIANKLAVIKNDKGTSITTEIKEELTSKHSRDLDGDTAEVKIKIEK